ncbi:unnamed protein product [Polarella glacialis]|uniref:Uncharacterized protein n=1 Tax=Polarella glacialis TaxID=89957 RepID=A0A813J2S8_POLGL|nr:unnamed protein product [Polarella glacialis]CAE8736442.1 unnamed protein product [Polarella glacialis]
MGCNHFRGHVGFRVVAVAVVVVAVLHEQKGRTEQRDTDPPSMMPCMCCWHGLLGLVGLCRNSGGGLWSEAQIFVLSSLSSSVLFLLFLLVMLFVIGYAL